jgi:hypothetical protein
MTVDGYGVEPAEVDQIVGQQVGERTIGEEDETWFMHLSSQLALLQAAAEQVSALRDEARLPASPRARCG